MASPKKNHRYVGLYVPVDILDRFDRLYPHMRTHILNKFLKYALSHKDFVINNLFSEGFENV